MFISIIDFHTEETDYSTHILITVLNEIGQPEQIIRFDQKTKSDFGEWIQSGHRKNRIEEFNDFQFFKALNKLSRKKAIFEFLSSNQFSTFTLEFECRDIVLTDIGPNGTANFSYLVRLPPDKQSDTMCEDRGYGSTVESDFPCVTSFEGLKYSMT